jgi:hypothetical protein
MCHHVHMVQQDAVHPCCSCAGLLLTLVCSLRVSHSPLGRTAAGALPASSWHGWVSGKEQGWVGKVRAAGLAAAQDITLPECTIFGMSEGSLAEASCA